MRVVRPENENELIQLIADAARDRSLIELRGGGSKAAIGASDREARIVNMCSFTGIASYDPAELVMTVGAGTPLSEVEAAAAEARQVFAFEPFDHGPVFGHGGGTATIAGVVAASVAGSRRVFAGGVRDHLLGFRAVSGHGEAFVAGGKVVKNVTGYDLPKLACGSWGRLFALTELTFKLVPAPQHSRTRGYAVATPTDAIMLIAKAMRSQAGIAAASYIPEDCATGTGRALFRIEGFKPSVEARCTLLDRLLGEGEEIGANAWAALQTLDPIKGEGMLWRVSLPPGGCAGFLHTMRAAGARWLVDWAGALVWLRITDPTMAVRETAQAAGGHAMLFGGADRTLSVFQPLSPSLAALETRVRRAFDPAGIFETGRF